MVYYRFTNNKIHDKYFVLTNLYTYDYSS